MPSGGGGDVTNSAASTGFALMRDPCAVWPGPRHTATGLRGDRDPFTYSARIRCTDNTKKERLFTSDMIRHTKPNHKRLNFSFCWLNPLPLEAEGLNCGKVAIFKLDIFVISEERTNVTKLTSIRLLSPCCACREDAAGLDLCLHDSADDGRPIHRWEFASFTQQNENIFSVSNQERRCFPT